MGLRPVGHLRAASSPPSRASDPQRAGEKVLFSGHSDVAPHGQLYTEDVSDELNSARAPCLVAASETHSGYSQPHVPKRLAHK